MTADHEHTPLTEAIREAYIGEPPYTLYEYTEEEIDRWRALRDARIIAAAEQRGAISAFRKTQESTAGFDLMYREYDDMINADYLIQQIDTQMPDPMEDDDDEGNDDA